MQICAVCRGTEFTANAGYYFCNECGTQLEEKRETEYEVHDSFHYGAGNTSQAHHSVTKIKSSEKSYSSKREELTSWEEFNIILASWVKELEKYGMKKRTKRVIFQLWASYLQKLEVAFYSTDKQKIKLPKLSFGYRPKDAQIIYNQLKPAKVKRKRRSRSTVSAGSRKAARKRQRSLVTAEYAIELASKKSSESKSVSEISVQSISSKNSSGGFQPLRFTKSAKKYLKSKTSRKHLLKHQFDALGVRKCHAGKHFYPGRHVDAEVITMRSLLSLVYLGTNIANDQIQLSDLIRFAREYRIEFVSPTQINEFQITISPRGMTSKKLDQYRLTTAKLAKLLEVTPVTPDMSKLCRRYLEEMCLPKELLYYIDWLLALHPEFASMHSPKSRLPNYEGRAMALIIMFLKLIFGLDGSREIKISESANLINKCVRQASSDNDVPLLFVWSDWVEYIEMRQLIISQCYAPEYIRQGNCDLKPDIILDFFDERQKEQRTVDDEVDEDEVQGEFSHIEKMFTNYYKSRIGDYEEKLKQTSLPGSLTPLKKYLEFIIANYSLKVCIPDGMKTKHESMLLLPFVNAKYLEEFIKKYNIDAQPETLVLNRNLIQIVKLEKSKYLKSVKRKVAFAEKEKSMKFIRVNHNNKKWNRLTPLPKSVNRDPKKESKQFKPTNDSSINNSEDKIQFCLSNFEYWTHNTDLLGTTEFEEFVQENLPEIFSWLLDKCAQTVEMYSLDLYYELLEVERVLSDFLRKYIS